MKIFLTGGAGFIGSHITDSLVKAGHEVIVYDDFSSGCKDNLKKVLDKIEVIEGNILDKEKLFKSCPKDVDLISHQAAQLEIFRCIDDPIIDLKTNTIGTINIFELAREKEIKKIINASSACVYGQLQCDVQDENHPTMPNWPYGVSKLASEHYARIYCESYGMQIVNLRYAIVYGSREWYGRVLTMFLSRLYHKKAPVVFGDGNCLRDFINVYDVVNFNDLCLDNDDVFCKSFNVGTGKGTSIKDLAKLVCNKLTDGRMEFIHEDVKEGEFSVNMPTRKRIPQELKAMVLPYDFAKSITGFEPRISLEEGIQQEYDWLCENAYRWNMEGVVKV